MLFTVIIATAVHTSPITATATTSSAATTIIIATNSEISPENTCVHENEYNNLRRHNLLSRSSVRQNW